MTKKYSPSSKKKLAAFICSAGAAAFFLIMPNGLLAEECKTPTPEKIEINIHATCSEIPGLPADTKKTSDFSHKLHTEKYLMGKSGFHSTPYTDDFTCVACHNGATSQEEITGADRCDRLTAAVSGQGGGENYKKQMHSMCVDCHKNMKKAGETTGPTKCTDCHKK